MTNRLAKFAVVRRVKRRQSCCVNAAGFYVPHMLIFRRKRFTELLLRNSPPGTIGACSANGWLDSELFIKWLTHFISVVKPSPTNKVILILDGHSSHNTLAAVDLARQHGIVMSLPPHTTRCYECMFICLNDCLAYLLCIVYFRDIN